jgi:hypothetical protein
MSTTRLAVSPASRRSTNRAAFLAAAAHVVGDLPDGPDRVLQGQVAQDGGLLDHGQDQVGGPDLEEGRPLRHVGVADDHVQAPVALGVGVGLVAGVDDRP